MSTEQSATSKDDLNTGLRAHIEAEKATGAVGEWETQEPRVRRDFARESLIAQGWTPPKE